VFFVTRLRHDAHYRVLEQCPIPRNRHILKEEIISLGSHHYRQAARFRRVEVWIEERQEVLVLLSNHLSFGSSTIAQIYRERWRIEVFFRYLKQNLRIKTFVGTSANALHIQIWTALIAILLLKYLQLRARYGWSLSNLVALLRQQLFVYRDLHTWLDEPFPAPPALDGLHDGQLILEFKLAL
jgi:IS4 transposase